MSKPIKFNLSRKQPEENQVVYLWKNGEPYGMCDEEETVSFLLPFIASKNENPTPQEPWDFFDLTIDESLVSTEGYDIHEDTIEWSPVYDKNGELYTEDQYHEDLSKAQLDCDRSTTDCFIEVAQIKLIDYPE